MLNETRQVREAFHFIVLFLLIIIMSSAPAVSVYADESDGKTVKLQLWTIWDGARTALMDRVVDEFEETYPWIKVEHVALSSSVRVERFMASIAAGIPPDVMMLGRHEIPYYAENGVVLPLDEHMTRDGFSGDIFFPSEFETTKWKNSVYILPQPTGAGVNGVVYYNKDHFQESGLNPDKLPETWAEFEDLGRNLNRWDGDGDLRRLGVDVRSGGDRWWLSWLHSNGGEYASSDGRQFTFFSEEGKETVEWLMNFTNVINRGPSAISRLGGSIVTGHRSMAISGVWQEFIYLDQNPDLNLGVGLIPHREGAETWLAQVGGWGYSVVQGTRHPYESWLLTKWLTTSEIGGFWFMYEQARPSPVIDYTLDRRYFDMSDNWSMMVEAMQRTKAITLTPIEPDIWLTVENPTLARAWSGEEPPLRVLEQYYTEAQRQLDAYWDSE